MKKILAVFLIICIVFTCAPLSFAKGDTSCAPASDEYVANEVLLTIDTTVKAAEPLPLTRVEIIDAATLESENTRIFKGTVEYGTDIPALCAELEQRADVLSAQPNYLQSIDSIALPQEVEKTGSDYNAFNWYKDALNLSEAWQSADTLGSEEVVVAVLDTGVNIHHREFEGAIWQDSEGHAGYNTLNDSDDVTDANGHGTNVAGIIAMRANDFGFVGIAPQVKIMPIKVSASVTISDADILEGLNYAIEHGADIINMSFGSSNVSDTMLLAYQRAAAKAVLVGAAGNSGYNAAYQPQYPAACIGVLGVMSYGSYRNEDRTHYTINNGQVSSFSNYDKTGKYYQVCAPGVEIEGPAHNSDTAFKRKTGTSQAAPIVAGAAALYKSLHPEATPYQIKTAVVETADTPITGYTDDTQYHGIDLTKLLGAAVPAEPTVDLSTEALHILSACLNEEITTPTRSMVDGCSVVSVAIVPDIKENLSGLFELTQLQIIELKDIGLTNADLAAFEDAAFENLFLLDVSNNKALDAIPFSAQSAPALRELYIDSCAFRDTKRFENLGSLSTLSASDNLFDTSYRFEKLAHLEELDASSCNLQDVTCFKDFSNLNYLDVHDNFITDISPLSGYCGAFLNISQNPLHLGVAPDMTLRAIESSMHDNDAASIRFYHGDLNGNESKEYLKARSVALENACFVREAGAGQLTAQITPADANIGTLGIYAATDERLSIGRFDGMLTWSAAAFEQTTAVPVTFSPTSAFTQSSCMVNILAPEVKTFTYRDSAFILTTNLAATAVKLGDITLTAFETQGDTHVFSVPDSVAYDSALCAVPYDSIGAGEAVRIGETPTLPAGEARILDFSSDKEEYFTGETATLRITATGDTASVKLADRLYDTETVLNAYTVQGDKHIFTVQIPVHSAATHRFKAYAARSADAFTIGGTALSFTARLAASRLKLHSQSGSLLYFTGNADTLQLQADLYPENCYAEAVTFRSTDTAVATVDAAGTVCAVDYGTAIITAESESGLQAVFPVVVGAPKMSDAEIEEGYTDSTTTATVYTAHADEILLKNADGSDVDFAYEITEGSSSVDGFESKWTISMHLEQNADIKIYAADENGINAHTQYRYAHIEPIEPVQSFSFAQSEYRFRRAGGPVKIALDVVPATSAEYFNWALSTNTVASMKAYENYCILTPIRTGSFTLSASTTIGGEEVTHSVTVSFEEGGIYSVIPSADETPLYAEIPIEIKTDKSIEYLTITDSNSLVKEYNEYSLFEDRGEYRYWTIPYYFNRESSYITVSGGDNVGNIGTSVRAEINAFMPEDDFAANPAVVRAIVGDISSFNLISLPSRANINYSKYTVTAEDESIASFNLGYVHVYQEGETILHCVYNGVQKDVRLIATSPIEEITLPESLSLYENELSILTPQVSPASSEKLYYESADEAVAAVDAAGVITAKQEGETTITVRSQGGVSAAVRVKVKSTQVICALAFDKALYEIQVGESLDYTLDADAPLRNKITYTCSNTNILGVSEDGAFTALKEGNVTITATADSGVSTSAEVHITADRQLALSRPVAQTTPGKYLSISVLAYPKGIDVDGTWFSDDEQIAIVGQDGTVYAKSPGTCNIYFLSDKGEICCCQIKVGFVYITRLNVESEVEMLVGDNHIIAYTKSLSNADESPIWSSNDPDIAAVDQNGFVYALCEGSTTITARLQNGKIYTVQLTVYAPALTLKAALNTAATLTCRNAIGTTQQFQTPPAFETNDFAGGTYTLTFAALHHTTLTIEDAAILTDTDLGNIMLCNGDANGDGIVDIRDISLLLAAENYGQSAAAAGTEKDINDDGVITIADVSETLLAENYGGRDKTILY